MPRNADLHLPCPSRKHPAAAALISEDREQTAGGAAATGRETAKDTGASPDPHLPAEQRLPARRTKNRPSTSMISVDMSDQPAVNCERAAG